MVSWAMALKRSPLDATLSDLIREAADWVCEKCGIEVPRDNGRAFHCSHFYSRANHQVRYFPDNLSALCASCHKQLGEAPALHDAFQRKRLGMVLYDELMLRAGGASIKYTKHDKAEMLKHYKAELARLRKLRKQGVTGRIEIVPYD